jgi:hypothetical protein
LQLSGLWQFFFIPGAVIGIPSGRQELGQFVGEALDDPPVGDCARRRIRVHLTAAAPGWSSPPWALEAAGLLTEAIREVRAPDHVAARDPRARRWRRIPLFLHLRAIKPG